jgi:hypothetical protein
VKKTSGIAGGILGILIGLAFVTPAISQLHETGVLRSDGVARLMLGLALTLAGVAATAYAAMRLRA